MAENTQTPYTPPSHKADAFNCPHCRAYARQQWSWIRYLVSGAQTTSEDFDVCVCDHCRQLSVWRLGKIVHPRTTTAPPANADLPEGIRADYDEAASIVNASPRGAAALLRLAIQKLCKHLGEKGKDVNADIGAMVEKGLPVFVQQSLDIVRVVGNSAVHPGQIDLKDDADMANKLFGLVNIISEVMITQPKHVKSIYEGVVPEAQREAIKKRDGA